MFKWITVRDTGQKRLLLSSNAKKEHSPTTESYQSNVCTGEQSSSTTTVMKVVHGIHHGQQMISFSMF